MAFITPTEVSNLPSKPADHRICYGDNPRQFGDLRIPDGSGPFPVAIVIHGGCWLSKYATLQNTAALSDALRDNGIATWNIEYRCVDHEGGGWPGTFLDVAQAADLLQTIAATYSLDLSHTIAVGHSAGGHLALWLAARHRLPSSSDAYLPIPLEIQGVVSMGGVPDLEGFRQMGQELSGQDIIAQLTAEHLGETSPIELLPLGVPQILIHGKQDFVVPEALAHNYVQAAKDAGDSVELFLIEDAAHHEYNAPHSVAWPTVQSAIFSLLDMELQVYQQK